MTLSELFSYILFFAAERGFMDIIQFILTIVNMAEDNEDLTSTAIQSQSHPTITLIKSITTHAIYAAFKGCHLDIIKLLLSLPNDDPTLTRHDEFIHKAVNDINVIKFLLLKVADINVEEIAVSVLESSSLQGQVETVKFIISTYPDIATFRQTSSGESFVSALSGAAGHGYLDIVKMLLEVRGDVDVSTALSSASAKGQLHIVKHLVNVKGLDPTSFDNAAMRNAAYGGHPDVVKFLVGFPGVDATAWDNQPIRNAASGGHLDVVKLLLMLPGVDPTACHNEAFRKAAEKGHRHVVELLATVPECCQIEFLVTLPCVDPASRQNEAIRKAATVGHLEVVKLLLSIPGVDSSACNNEALCTAAFQGSLDIVKVLLTAGGVDPAVPDNQPFKNAAFKGRLEVVRLFYACPGVIFHQSYPGPRFDAVQYWLKHSGVNALQINRKYLSDAIVLGGLDVVRLLVEFPGVDVTFGNNSAIKCSVRSAV
ncbi:hypothetical protein HDU76_006966 [Blyttiomyces sp. JEL0837]|nr:hypothetical protein HDU76_006966 [Blyttiomyces sp. JEL0837]